MVKKVVVVGGGTAGWMTASYLKKAFQRLDITLVESATLRTVGVGEGTFSTIKLFFDYLGLDERDWMPRCNATYKLGIRFKDWATRPGHFYHPFQRFEVIDGFNLAEWWLRLKQTEVPFDHACFAIPSMCDTQRSPRFFDGTIFDESVSDHFGTGSDMAQNKTLNEHSAQYPYAYHFDAALLADFLKDIAVGMGVRHVVDDVVEVPLTADGSIARLVTRDHGILEGDLYVDCSGFRSFLVNQTLGDRFLSSSDTLLCDRALALRVPVDLDITGLDPCTTATALSSGWSWTIPLYGRLGTGYVYSSQFQSQEEAEREMRASLGPAAEGISADPIRMRVGRQANAWVKNCVAIGLAAGFLEPLEASTIFMIQNGIEELVRHFPGDSLEEAEIRSYNRVVGQCFDSVRDFIVIHYAASDRMDSPFWRATKESLVLREELAERLELWRQRLPDHRTIPAAFHGFEAYSYATIMLGVSSEVSQSPRTAVCHLDEKRALEAFRSVQARTRHLVSTLPSQLEYLTFVREGASRVGHSYARPQAAMSMAGVA
jgi:flavin-dependent dehydrogenase